MSISTQKAANPELKNFGRPTSREKIEYRSRSDSQTTYSVDLSSINIKDAPDLSKYKHCKSVDLSCNQIQSIWHETFLPCIQLKEIKLYSNKLSKIEGMRNLHHLESLQLQYNRIEEIGESLKDCRNLKSLRLDSNFISNMKVNELVELRQLTYLDISSNKMEGINAVCTLQNLQELHCSHNTLTSIPDLSGLKKLHEIDISFNSLTSLKGLKGMLNLTVLCVKNNFITSLSPMKISKSLTDLDISHNKIQKLGNVHHQFPNIETLNFSHNAIASLGEIQNLHDCSELKEIDVQDNPIMNDSTVTADLKSKLAELNLEFVNGKYMRKRDFRRPSSAVLMRPMSANQLVSERLISDQLQYDSLRLMDFEEKLKLQFAGIKGLLEELPKEKSRNLNTSLSTKHIREDDRPQSRCSSRHRIAEARAFAEKTFRTGHS